jgi:hypothetical protein
MASLADLACKSAACTAELLLVEIRRQRPAQFSDGSVKRLETIAALTVRMRETVQRLSQACEARSEQARSA